MDSTTYTPDDTAVPEGEVVAYKLVIESAGTHRWERRPNRYALIAPGQVLRPSFITDGPGVGATSRCGHATRLAVR